MKVLSIFIAIILFITSLPLLAFGVFGLFKVFAIILILIGAVILTNGIFFIKFKNAKNTHINISIFLFLLFFIVLISETIICGPGITYSPRGCSENAQLMSIILLALVIIGEVLAIVGFVKEYSNQKKK